MSETGEHDTSIERIASASVLIKEKQLSDKSWHDEIVTQTVESYSPSPSESLRVVVCPRFALGRLTRARI